jgi:CRP-like cAMP-binding protein
MLMDKARAAAVMAANGWLSRRPAEFRKVLIDACRLRLLAAGEMIVRAEDPASGMVGLVEGRWRMTMPPADTMINVETPGFWVGDAAAFRQADRMVNIVAVTRCAVLHLPQDAFERLITDPVNCRHIAINTAETLGRAIIVMANLTQPVPEIRIAQQLLTFAGVYEGARRNLLACSQAEAAQMCGLSRQTTNMALRQLAERGIIALGYRRIEILDFAALQTLAIDDDRIWR